MKTQRKILATSITALAISVAAFDATASTAFSVNALSETASTLSVSWAWDLDRATSAFETSSPSLTHWSAQAIGGIYNFGDGNEYLLRIRADSTPNSTTFEYRALVSGVYDSYINFMTSRFMDNGYWYDLTVSGKGHYWDIQLNGIAPVPEPEGYAMFLAGLGLMGLIAGRRRSV